MAEFKLDRFKYNWRNNWQTGVAYSRDDIVKFGGKTFVCLITHTASANFYTDKDAVVPGSTPPIPAPKWVVMTDGVAFAGTWQSGVMYKEGDIVYINGSLYKCTTHVHTSSTWEADESSWEVYANHIDFIGNWSSTTEYAIGAIVKYNGIAYRCISTHTSAAAIEDNIDDWEVYYEGIEYRSDWSNATSYFLNDLVKYGGSLYRCVEAHNSLDEEFNFNKFQLELSGYAFENRWIPTKYYKAGDVVRDGGYLYYSLSDNIDSNPSNDDSTINWIVLAYGYNFVGNWSPSSYYRAGDVVLRGGNLYLCKMPIGAGDNDGSTRDYEDGITWELLVEGQTWSKNHSMIEYQVRVEGPSENEIGNSYVFDYMGLKPALEMHEGNLYVFVQDDLTNVYYPNDPYAEVPIINSHPLNFSNNTLNGLLTDGGLAYTTDVTYYLDNQIVTFSEYNDSNTFAAATYRRVEIYVTKDTPNTLYYWCYNHENMGSSVTVTHDFATGSWKEGREYLLNEVVYFGGSAYKCNYQHISDDQNFPGDNGSGYTYWDILIQGEPAGLLYKGDLLTYNLSRGLQGDESTIDITNLPIGEERQLLSVTGNDTAFWRDYVNDAEVIYVSTQGSDEDGYGTTKHRPFKSVRYAAEYVEDNFSPLTPVKISISTGRYEEIGPISVPAGTVVMGDELRSTTIVATNGLADYANDYFYMTMYFDRLTQILYDILNNNKIIPQPGNDETQVTSLPAAGTGIATIVNSLKDDFIQYCNFRINSTGTDATVTSTNTMTTEYGRIYGANVLHANRNFISNELALYIQQQYPDYTFNTTRMRHDIRAFIRGAVYDLKYPGNYKTVLAARRYVNAILGSQSDDLFYMRDVTGLRNCTLGGLYGTLNPPGVFELYQRPTGGAFTSLDPGWGPNDERVWIMNRSPYMQGVTNIGTGCTGAKVDGSLHNGGLKSFVTNDYTQVLSDGIGFWTLNNARAELVSMFTYYCSVGYLAESGGVIRATNGNNSYGLYGSIADGIDSTEVPVEVNVDNRTTQAVVNNVFAGEFTDQIFNFEYAHCGENYTSASASIIGSGINANVEFRDFRDGALFQARLYPSDGSSGLGGAGYTTEQNNAQTGGTTSITLAVAEDITVPEIEGQRLIIVSGDGTGQYGIVASYSNATKIATMVKESDGTLGWDHVIPGYPIAPLLTSNTQYRIEPVITVDHPGFTSESFDLSGSNTIADATFGDTTLTFSNVVTQLGTGNVETQDGLAPAPAQFTVVKNGKFYSLTLTDTGAGYAIGDELTISGDDVGGVSPTNDILIRVKSITDDSVNGIVDYYFEGIGSPGRFVVLTNPNTLFYSDDAETWDTTTMPASGNWRKVISGNNRFIALRSASAVAGFSNNGISWTTSSLPSTENWIDAVWGSGKFVAVAEDSNTVAYSTTGETWSSATIPNAPSGDSTSSQWVGVAYGDGKYVIISGSDRAVATSSNGITWTRTENALPVGIFDWVDVVFGNNRFIAMTESGDVYSSFNGTTWTNTSNMPTQDGSTVMKWNRIKYSQGVFFAVCDTGGAVVGADVTTGPTTFCATSEDGILWAGRELSSQSTWATVATGTVGSTPLWVAVGSGSGTGAVAKVRTGCRAKLRSNVSSSGRFNLIEIWDPGSGYDADNPPTISLIDNSATTEAAAIARIGNGVLAQPDFINRGTGYRTSSTIVTITGDGYADIIPDSDYVTLSGIETVPGPGAQLLFETLLDEETPVVDDLRIYTAVTIEDLGDDGTGTGLRKVKCRVSPKLETIDNLEHGTLTYIRERYSQCRISGHDFLDVGTGNFEETNYPEIYAGGNYFVAAPENEVLEQNGGRVFYTSTDQDGNFRTGELFSVQQATGIVTISAQFFDLDGLSELALGGVRLGGSGAVIREFSTDPYFSEDSNNVVPTQRAIATFLANRLSVGGSDLETNELIAGRVRVGGPDNVITTTIDIGIQFVSPAVFEGAETGITGHWVAQMMLHRNPFDDSMQ